MFPYCSKFSNVHARVLLNFVLSVKFGEWKNTMQSLFVAVFPVLCYNHILKKAMYYPRICFYMLHRKSIGDQILLRNFKLKGLLYFFFYQRFLKIFHWLLCCVGLKVRIYSTQDFSKYFWNPFSVEHLTLSLMRLKFYRIHVCEILKYSNAEGKALMNFP